MKKLFVTLLLASSLLFGCETKICDKIPNVHSETRFTVVERTNSWQIVYDRETLVMYAVSDGASNYGTFTLLVDADGKPLTWKGGENNCP